MTGLTMLMWLLFATIIGMVIFLVMTNKYKHKVTIKHCISGNKVVTFDKAMIVKRKDGTVWWRLQKAKELLPPPPDACVEITKKGRYSVQYYKLENGGYIPAQDGFDPKDSDKLKDIISTTQPYTTNQRVLMHEQHVKAERDKKKTTKELIAAAIPYIALVMIIAVFMIFYGEAVKPIKDMNVEAGAQWVEISDNMLVATSQLDSIINDRMKFLLKDINTTTPEPGEVPN